MKFHVPLIELHYLRVECVDLRTCGYWGVLVSKKGRGVV